MAITIALADDHQLVRKGIRLLLETIHDFEVVIEAPNGRELIDQIKATTTLPDLVFVDVNMPVLNGQETVKELRATYPEMKIIALSVNDELHIIRELIQLGANAYLFKDSSPEMFKKVLFEVYEKGYYYDKQVIESLLSHDKTHASTKSVELLNDQLRLLTPREKDFIKLCCTEVTYKEMSTIMGVGNRTIDGYRENIFNKCELKSRTGIVVFAFKTGLVSIDTL